MDQSTLVDRVQRMLAQAQAFLAYELPQEAAARANLAVRELDAALGPTGRQPELVQLRDLAAERVAQYEAEFRRFSAASTQRKAAAYVREVHWLQAPLPKKSGVSY